MTSQRLRIRAAEALLAMLALALGSGSCDGGETQPTGGTVTGVVSYSGTAQGTLCVAAFTEWPTLSAPEMYVTIPAPAYPQAYTLEGLDPGDYYIFAFIDVAPASPTMPGDEDIKSTPSVTTHVSDSQAGTADIALPAD
jgi:hypothetical protein